MCKVTLFASGADLAKFNKYLSENVRETCCWRTIETLLSSEDSSVFACAGTHSHMILAQDPLGNAKNANGLLTFLLAPLPLAAFLRFLVDSSSSSSSSSRNKPPDSVSPCCC